MVVRRSWGTAHTVAVIVALLLGLAAFLASRSADGSPNSGRIAAWYGDGGPDSLLGTATAERLVIEIDDVQYGAKTRFRGFWLAPLLERGLRPGFDRVLLRFDNGMIVPVDVGRWPEMFVAVSVWSSGKWISPPAAHRKDKVYDDLRPIVFGWNKIVVADGEKGFTPWRHTSTLTAVEYVDTKTFVKPFEAGSSASLVRGRDVFLKRCQFCHAVAGHGATLGWDFIVPLPVTEYRSTSKNLRIHVNHRVSNAAELGLLMPVPGQLTEDDAKALWSWIDALAKQTTD